MENNRENQKKGSKYSVNFSRRKRQRKVNRAKGIG